MAMVLKAEVDVDLWLEVVASIDARASAYDDSLIAERDIDVALQDDRVHLVDAIRNDDSAAACRAHILDGLVDGLGVLDRVGIIACDSPVCRDINAVLLLEKSVLRHRGACRDIDSLIDLLSDDRWKGCECRDVVELSSRLRMLYAIARYVIEYTSTLRTRFSRWIVCRISRSRSVKSECRSEKQNN